MRDFGAEMLAQEVERVRFEAVLSPSHAQKRLDVDSQEALPWLRPWRRKTH